VIEGSFQHGRLQDIVTPTEVNFRIATHQQGVIAETCGQIDIV